MDTTKIEELNRWREAGIQVGRKLGVVAERERIIRLLDKQIGHSLCDILIERSECEPCHSRHRLVAIIKGENE